jgi:hypothetical protein
MATLQTVPAVAEDLAWLVGSWRGLTAGNPIEEHWSTPGGGVLMCMIRWLKQGKVYLYEFVTIEPEADTLVLRIKHFSLGGIGWEERTEAVTFYLTALAHNEAIFDLDDSAAPARLLYRRDGDNLYCALDSTRDGQHEFRYELATG